ncbi:LysR family transcriptional regulator [Tabrizicola sp.]|uniref:LysR family transcriptional regulator n=1 Tax=Tabrizicola sp. TaxID=2005166 RepID=UPI00286C9561|nr:LysR family transcriptional regulator [Tabrizicola sp.]
MASRMTPDWNDLRPFLALARAGSFSGAARALGTRHSTVIRRVGALEQALGARLVHRTAAGAVLTELGERVLLLAQVALRSFAAFAAAATEETRVWRLALPSGLAPLIGPDLAALRAKRPDLAVDLSSGSQLADVAAGEADIALRSRPGDEPTLVVRKVAEAGWSLYASPAYLEAHPFDGDLTGHKLTGYKLTGHKVIGLHADLADTPADRWLLDHAGAGTTVMRLAQMADLVATAQAGVGLALLPCILADPAPGLVRLLPEVLLAQPLFLVCRRDVADDPRARLVIRCLAYALRRAAPVLRGRAA